MIELTYKDVCDRIVAERINFVVFSYTAWHINGAKTSIKMLQSLGVEVKPLFLVMPHYRQGMQVEHDNEVELYKFEKRTCPRFCRASYFSYLIKCATNSISRGNIIYIVSSLIPDYEMAYYIALQVQFTPRFVVFDEGLKSYLDKYGTWQHLWKHTHRVPETMKLFFENHLSSILKKKGVVTYCLPLNPGKSLTYNENVIKLYRETLHIDNMQLDANNVILVLQEPKDYGMEILRSIIPGMVKRGYKVYVKPHPRFPLSGIGSEEVEMLNSKLSLEEIQKTVKAKNVIGFTSTAILSMSYLFGCNTISVIKMIPVETIPEYVDSAYKVFVAKFAFICKFPVSRDELFEQMK